MPFSSTQLEHRWRNLSQRISKPVVAVVGGYHGGNLGDMALGEAVVSQLQAKRVKSGLQTIYNVERWPFVETAIVGGGAVGYSDVLEQLVRRYGGSPQKVALLGVDFNSSDYPDDVLRFIEKCAWVSCRSTEQAKRVAELTGREVSSHPDLAFSLLQAFCSGQRQKARSSSKKLLVNVVPLYGNLVDDRLEPALQYQSERPELFQSFERMQRSYRHFVRETVGKAVDEGYEVESVPFTPADKRQAELMLDGLPVKHHEYRARPTQVLQQMATADWVLATRFHATIFALKLGVRLSAVAYAKKNEALLGSLGLSTKEFRSAEELAEGVDSPIEVPSIDDSLVAQMEQDSTNAIQKCIQALGISA